MQKMVNGQLVDMSAAEIAARQAEETAWVNRPVDPAAVNFERERRILAGTSVTVLGAGAIPIQGRDEDARNLQALAFGASLRIAGGDTSTLTTFHDAVNENHELTPAQVVALWKGAADYVSGLYAASWAIKALDPIPADFAADSHWQVIP